MKRFIRKLSGLGLLSLMFCVLNIGTAAAHVVVRPAEAKTASFNTFTIGVPNERDVATVRIKLDMPAGLEHVSPTVKPGWSIATETEAHAGEESEGAHASPMIKSIIWTGGAIPAGQRDDFTFSAKVPAEATELRWNAYQTYADGVTVSWSVVEDEQPKNEDGSPDFSTSGPFSVTKVVAETEAQGSLKKVEAAAANADKAADRALYVGIIAGLLGVGGIVLALRKS